MAERSNIQSMRLPTPKLGMEELANTEADWHNNLYRVLCLPYAKQLAQVLRDINHKFFVVAFDECSYLGIRKSTQGSEYSRRSLWGMSLIALLRIIKASDNFDMQGISFWYLLLDTSPSVSDLASYGPNAPSYRLTKELSLLPPWTYLGFNQMVDVGHSKGIMTPADVLSVSHQKKYGRNVSSDTCTLPFFFFLIVLHFTVLVRPLEVRGAGGSTREAFF